MAATVEGTLYGRSGFNAIDNDFSLDLLLAPYRVEDFRRAPSKVAAPAVVRHLGSRTLMWGAKNQRGLLARADEQLRCLREEAAHG